MTGAPGAAAPTSGEHHPGPIRPALADLLAAPAAIAEFRERCAPLPDGYIDLGVGDPRAPYPDVVRRALCDGIPEISTYPTAAGTPQLRAAIADWYGRRFGVHVDPATDVLPTNGSKEAVASLAGLVAGDPARNIVVVPDPGYDVPAKAARLAGADVVPLALHAADNFAPDLSTIPAHVWDRTAVLWLNYPNNPTGATVGLGTYTEAARLAARHGFWLASDEAYSEVWHGNEPDAPPSALQAADRDRVIAFTSLSKRSGVPGLRSGAVVGPAPLMSAMRKWRITAGMAPSVFVQAAATAAWTDETHVHALRAQYTRRHRILLDAVDALGWRCWGRHATPFVWAEVPADRGDAETVAVRLAQAGVLCTPGNFFGANGAGFVRFAAVADDAELHRAAHILANFS